MAVSPILLNSLPFDATLDHILHFTYNGAQVFATRVVIKNNETLETVYDKKKTGMSLMVTIPENTLVNGNTYSFQVSVFDYEDKESPLSNAVVLKCFATPTFGFVNVTEGMTIRNSYIDIELIYECSDEFEVLNQYRLIVYGVDKSTIIYDSGTSYSTAGMIVRVSGLTDDSTYYIQATCETLSGMEITTDLIQVICDYIKPDLFLAFYADNVPSEGLVRLTSNFISIEGESDPEELVYIDDEKVSLINGEKVWFDSGYVANDFVVKMIAENIIDYSKVISFDMKNVKAYVMWYKGIFEGDETETYYAELVAYQYIGDEPLNYIQISNRIEPLDDEEQVFFWIRHVKGMFDIQIQKLTKQEASEIIEGGDVA